VTVTLMRPSTAAPVPTAPPRRVPWAVFALFAICAVQVVLAERPGFNQSPFEDEGLYIYMGHRMISHLLHGTFVTEFPGAYFSGAPGFYPVLAAIGDHVAGLLGARAVSLLFAVGATISVNGLGRQLYGKAAGLLGAAAFVLCGSVIYQSTFATFDSTTMCCVAAAAWLTVYSAKHDGFLWAPAVAGLLVAAFYAKYAGAVYTPVVAALAVASAPRGRRLTVLRGTVVMLLAAVVLGFFVFTLWGLSLREGIVITTTSRVVLNAATAGPLLHSIGHWVGPWLVLAVLGSLLTWRTWRVSAVLLGGSVIAPLEQIRIGEATSLAKHVAFGMVFACPLIGALFARLLSRKWLRLLTAPVVAGAFVLLAMSGLHYSHLFMTGWVNDAPLLPPLERLIAATPGKPILGVQSPPERAALRSQTTALQWNDTYAFAYDHRTGVPAYEDAINQTSFGVIYLGKQPYPRNPNGSPTQNGAAIYDYLRHGQTPYRLAGTVDRVLRGAVVGKWYLFIPKAAHLPPTWASTPGVTPSSTVPYLPVSGGDTVARSKNGPARATPIPPRRATRPLTAAAPTTKPLATREPLLVAQSPVAVMSDPQSPWSPDGKKVRPD